MTHLVSSLFPQADVTLIVGPEMERIRAHKAILKCRSSFFREALAENQTELYLEARFSVLKIALEVIYTGWTDADIPQVASELLALACKFGLTYLINLCSHHIQESLSASNVVDAVILANKLEEEDLFQSCVPVIKASAHRLSANDLTKLQQEPELLRKLFIDCCMKPWE